MHFLKFAADQKKFENPKANSPIISKSIPLGKEALRAEIDRLAASLES